MPALLLAFLLACNADPSPKATPQANRKASTESTQKLTEPAEEQMPKHVAEFFRYSETWRQQRIAELEKRIDRLRQERGRRDDTRDAFNELSKLKEAAPYTVVPSLPVTKLRAGASGFLVANADSPSPEDDGIAKAKVVKVLDVDKAVLNIFDKDLYLQGLATASLVEGSEVRFELPVRVEGSFAYDTPAGRTSITGLIVLNPAEINKWANRARSVALSKPTVEPTDEAEAVADTGSSEAKSVDDEPEMETKQPLPKDQRQHKQADLKLQLAERYRFRDKLKAARYAQSAIDLAPGTETAKKAKELLDSL